MLAGQRLGMDASQYKDYVLGLLFIKYVSDKYAGKPSRPSRSRPRSHTAKICQSKQGMMQELLTGRIRLV